MSWCVKIEHVAAVKALLSLQKLLYCNERDGTAVFEVAKWVDGLFGMFSNGQVCLLPSTEHILMQGINWANKENITEPESPPPGLTMAQVKAQWISTNRSVSSQEDLLLMLGC